MHNDYIVIYKDIDNDWRWSYRAANHEKMGNSGEGYEERTDLLAAIERVCGGRLKPFEGGLTLYRVQGNLSGHGADELVPLFMWTDKQMVVIPA